MSICGKYRRKDGSVSRPPITPWSILGLDLVRCPDDGADALTISEKCKISACYCGNSDVELRAAKAVKLLHNGLTWGTRNKGPVDTNKTPPSTVKSVRDRKKRSWDEGHLTL